LGAGQSVLGGLLQKRVVIGSGRGVAMVLQSLAMGQPSGADYGLDAPGAVRNLLLLAAAGIVALITMFLGLWSQRSRIAMLLDPLISGGIIAGAVASYMIWYSKVGKAKGREKYLNRLQWSGNERVLDVGCGRGLFLIGAAKRLKSGKAVGVDIWQNEDLSGNSQQAAQANAAAEGVADRIEVKTGDARELPFEDGSFDMVLSSVALHNIYDRAQRDKAIGEIARVLKPAGRVLITDIRHTHQYAAELQRRGMTSVQVHKPLRSYLGSALTMGSVRFGVVTATKSATHMNS
jgi:arsenite methyltransferase